MTDDGEVDSQQIDRYPTVASLCGRSGTLPHELSYNEMKEIAYEERLTARYIRDVQATPNERREPQRHDIDACD